MAASPRSRSSRTTAAATTANAASSAEAGAPSPGAPDADWLATVAELSFQEARTALDLAMAQLQSETLEVEEMAGLYRRAEAYARRCEAVLQQVEQEVIQWDDKGAPPSP